MNIILYEIFILIKIISTNICEIKIVTNPKENHVYLFSTTTII